MVLSAQWEPDKAGNAGQKKKKKQRTNTTKAINYEYERY